MKIFRIAMISLDSSHAVELTRLIQGDVPSSGRVIGMRVVACCRFPSQFQSESGQDKRQELLESWGVPLTSNPETAAQDADGLFVSLNNPADHWPMMEQLIKLGKPIFLDKPLADTVAHGKAIMACAATRGVPLWSASSIPLIPSLLAVRKAVEHPLLAHAYGPLGQAPTGSSVIWYGCHTFESMTALMGTKAISLRALEDKHGVVVRILYPQGRGVVELNVGIGAYGGRLSNDKETRSYKLDPDVAIYRELALAVRDFFLYNEPPLPLENSLAALILAEATDESLRQNGAEIIL